MQPNIDARLERQDPMFRLLDAESGRELARPGPEAVREMIEAEGLGPRDLADAAVFGHRKD